jgi:hypothetical protein
MRAVGKKEVVIWRVAIPKSTELWARALSIGEKEIHCTLMAAGGEEITVYAQFRRLVALDRASAHARALAGVAVRDEGYLQVSTPEDSAQRSESRSNQD